MNPQFRHAVPYRLHIAHQAAFQPLEPRDHHAANGDVDKAVKQAVNSGSGLIVNMK